MRLRILAFAAALPVALLLVPAAPAQAPARARATAHVASGDLGIVGRAAVRGAAATPSRTPLGCPGWRSRRPRDRRAARAGGAASARASATAELVSLFDGLVAAERVSRTATAQDGSVRYAGSVTRPRGRRRGAAATGRARRLLGRRRARHRQPRRPGHARAPHRAVAGFAAGTTVVVAEVDAAAVDGADPAATPEPAAAERPAEAATPTRHADAAPPSRRSAPRSGSRAGASSSRSTATSRCADDFGAARQIGAHKGNDCFAAFGSPVLAVADGTLNRVGTLPICGNRLWLKTERGDAFFYAHLSAFAPEAVSGRKVKAGTLLGFVGNTGDAEPTPPHVHFEIHPGDRKAIDPHAVLAAWQAAARCPTGGWLARYGSDTEARPARSSRCATSSRGSENDEGRHVAPFE